METKETKPFVYDDGFIHSTTTDTTLTLTIWDIEIPFTINNKNDGQPCLKSPRGIMSLVIQQQIKSKNFFTSSYRRKEGVKRYLIDIQRRILTKTNQYPRGGTDYLNLIQIYFAMSQLFNEVHFVN